MKKVLLMALALGLLASPAMANVATTKHNLATTGPGTVKSNNYSEVCVFCHTPHGASTSVTNAPLWNRNYTINPALVAADLYTSTTLTPASTPDAALATAIAATDAPLCFSCHDGTSVTGALVNPSNLAANVQPTGIGVITTADILGDGAGLNKLKNDHPIGMNYAAAVTADAGGLVATPAGITFYGGRMWCSSCHDVHNNTHAPFLAKSNAGSALCISCHNK